MLTSGTLLQDRYRVDRLLEMGSMGGMYRAWDVEREAVVSVKELVPQPDLAADVLERLVQQIVQEVQTLATLDHPAMGRAVDFFQAVDADTGRQNAYLVMDFVEGESLADCIARLGALPEDQVVAWAGQLLDVLAYCHDHGVLHHDIKPQNVILRADGSVALVGFELSKLWDPNDPRTWTATRVMGSPEYAPPERWGLQTWHIDVRSDLYSLGATLYHALTGQAPLTAGERTANPYRFLPVQALQPRVSARVRSAIVRALELPQRRRFQNAAQMKAALQESSPLRISEVVLPAALMLPERGALVWRWLLLIVVGVVVLSAAGIVGVLGPEFFVSRLAPETTLPVNETLVPSDGTLVASTTSTVIPTLAPTVLPVETTGSVEITPPVETTGSVEVTGSVETVLPTSTALPPAEVPTDWPLALTDGFDDNGNAWVVGGYEDDWGTVTRAIAEGVYTWEITALQSVGRWCLPEIAQETDFYLSVEARRAAGPVDASYGLVFRHGEGSYYLFSIRDDGFFNLNLWHNFAWTSVVDWTGTYAVRPGEVNRLAVRAEGTQFTLYVNDAAVAQAQNDVLAAGDAGLSVLLVTPGDAVFTFDNFEIRVP